MAPRAFRKYGPPTKRAIAEQMPEYEPEYDAAMARLDAYEASRTLETDGRQQTKAS